MLINIYIFSNKLLTIKYIIDRLWRNVSNITYKLFYDNDAEHMHPHPPNNSEPAEPPSDTIEFI